MFKRRTAVIVAALVLLSAGLGLAALADDEARVLRIPAGTTLIEEEAFMNVSVDEIILPEGIKTIDARAFAGTGAQRVYLPDSIEFIGPDAFDSTTLAYAYDDTYAMSWAQQNDMIVLGLQEPEVMRIDNDNPVDVLEVIEGTAATSSFIDPPGGDERYSGLALRQWRYSNSENWNSELTDYFPGLDDVVISAEAQPYVTVAWMDEGARFGLNIAFGAAQSENMWERTLYEDAVTVKYTWRGQQKTYSFDLRVYHNTYVTQNAWAQEAAVGAPLEYSVHQWRNTAEGQEFVTADLATSWTINGYDNWFDPEAVSGDITLGNQVVGRYYWDDHPHASRVMIVWLVEGTYNFEVYDDNYVSLRDFTTVTRDSAIAGADVFWNESSDEVTGITIAEGGEGTGFYGYVITQDGSHFDACYVDSVEIAPSARDYIDASVVDRGFGEGCFNHEISVTARYGAAQGADWGERTRYEDAVIVRLVGPDGLITRYVDVDVAYDTHLSPNNWSNPIAVGVPALYDMHRFRYSSPDDSEDITDNAYECFWTINGEENWYDPESPSGDIALGGETVGRYYWDCSNDRALTIVWLREGSYTFSVNDCNPGGEWVDTVTVTRDSAIAGVDLFWNEIADAEPVTYVWPTEGGDVQVFYGRLDYGAGVERWDSCYVDSVEIAPAAQGYIEADVTDRGYNNGNSMICVRALYGAAQEEDIYAPSFYEDAVIVRLVGPDGMVTRTVDVNVNHNTFVTPNDWAGEAVVGEEAPYSVHQKRYDADGNWVHVSADFEAHWTINGVEWYTDDPDALSGNIVIGGVTVGTYSWSRAYDNALTITWLAPGTYTITCHDSLDVNTLAEVVTVTE